jgi:hypothetical protein
MVLMTINRAKRKRYIESERGKLTIMQITIDGGMHFD